MFDLNNKIAIITGGSTHLGKAMAEGICSFGGNAILCSRNAERNCELANRLNKKYSTECIGVGFDFCDEYSIDNLLEIAMNKYGRVDILINNSSFSIPEYIENQNYNDFIKGLEGTIGGTYNITRKVLKIMITQNYGNIINIASMYGIVSPNPDLYENTSIIPNPVNYGCGKAAIIQFTKYIACNYAKYNIRANCIAPGAFPSSYIQENKGFIENLKKKIPMNRIGMPNDIQGVTVFLASDASSYITGQSISVDGGWTAW